MILPPIQGLKLNSALSASEIPLKNSLLPLCEDIQVAVKLISCR